MSSLSATANLSAERSLTRSEIVGAVALVGMLVLLFWDFFRRQVQWAIEEQADWGHTLVIPFIAAYFVRLRRAELIQLGLRTTWLGLLPVIVGAAWYSLCVFGPPTLAHHNLRGAGVAMTIGGLTVLFCGWRAMTILWFPLLYLVVFGQTISDRLLHVVTFTMQDWTAVGAHWLLTLLGTETDIEGNTLTVWDDGVPRPLNIAEACSGMRMLMAFLALGAAMSYTGLPRWWQRVLLIALGFPIALFVNVLRVITLGLLSFVNTDFTAGDFHTFVGLVWLVPAFGIFLGAMWIVKNIVKEGA